MSATNDPADEKSKGALERENEKLRAELERAKAELERERKKLERERTEIERLRRSLDAAVRSGKRQATPFSRGTRKKNPKRPGRKRGQGPFRRRGSPAQDTVVGPPIQVPVEETVCPDCGGVLEHERVDEVSVTDVPVAPKPEAKVYAVEVRRCCGCGRKVRGRHAAVAPDQHGATALIGQRKEALDALERADQAGIVDVFVLRRDEAFAPVEDDERFKALLKAIGVKRYIAMLERKERDSFQKPDEVMPALALRPGERVADIGAGSGYFTLRVARAVGPSGEVLAIDAGPKPWSERPWGPPPGQKRAREEVDEAMATSGLVPSEVHELLTEPFFVEYVAR